MSNTIKISLNMAASNATIFDFSQDYHHRLTWDPFFKKAQLIDAQSPRKGVRAWCVTNCGLAMETVYVSYLRPKVTAIKMTRGPWMFKSFAGSWRFEQKEAKRTTVTFTYTYTLRFPFNIMDFLVQPLMQKQVKQRLHQLRNHVES